MKCTYKRGDKDCKKSAIYVCSGCQTQEFYCRRHGEAHEVFTKHEIVKIGSSGLSLFKKEIKAYINSITKDAEAIITVIRKTSMNAIIELKKVNKNVKCIEELALKPFDENRISFLIQQAKQINLEMSESPIQTSERLSNVLVDKETEINTLRTEVRDLKVKLTEKDSKLQQMSQSATSKPNIIPAPQPVQPPQRFQPPQKVQTAAPMPTLNNAHQGTK